MKQAIIINLDHLKALLLEFIAERAEFSSDDDTLRRQLLFSEFLSWAQKYQKENQREQEATPSIPSIETHRRAGR